MKHLQKLLLLLVLLVAGAQSAWGYIYYFKRDTVLINGVSYELVHITVNTNYDIPTPRTANIIGISSTSNSVTIPTSVGHDGGSYGVTAVGKHAYLRSYPKTYYYNFSDGIWLDANAHYAHMASIDNNNVTYSQVAVSNNYVRELTFSANGSFFGNFTSTSLTTLNFQRNAAISSTLNVPNLSNLNLEGDLNISGTLTSNSLREIHFNKLTCTGKFNCPNLKNVYFTNNNVSFSGQWGDHFTVSKNTVIAHVYGKTEQEIAALRNATVWCDFKDIIGHKTQYDVTLASNGGGEVQLWKTNGSNSQLQYTMSDAGGQETVPLYDNADSYQIRLYYDNANYETPVLRRNGVEVTTTNGNGYCYYNETNHMNVNSYGVEYNRKPYRQLHLVNLGNGTVEIYGKLDGVTTSYTNNGAVDRYIRFDYSCRVLMAVTPDDGYEVQKIVENGKRPMSFTTNASGVASTEYIFNDNASEYSLRIYYKKKTIPDGTPFNVHMAVEGTLGVGAVFFDNDGDYDWSDSDIESNDFSYQMDPGGSENVIGIYHPADGPTMGFRVVNYLSAEEIAAGFTCTVKVYSNRGEVVSSGPSEWGGDYYSIPLDGTDTDVRVVFETNGRYIRGNNGDGGTVEIYCEGDDTPLSITESGSWFYPLLPKTGNPYAVITPQEGKTVTAILRDGSLLSPSAFLQSDGTYRVPLQGFDRDDSYYEIYIIYSEDMTVVEPTGITWSGVAAGEFLEDANLFEAMLNDDSTNFRIFTRQGTTFSTFGQKFDDDAYSLKVSLIVKDGYDFKVYFNGEEFPHTFTKSTLIAEQGLFLYTFETTDVATITPFLVDGTWSVEFKKPEATDVIEWNLLMVGDVDVANNENPKTNAIWVVGGDELLSVSEGASLKATCNIDKTWYQPTDTYLGFYINVKPGQTFKASFNGTDVTDIFVRNANYDNDDGTLCYIYEVRGYEQFATSGTWVVEVKNADLLTQHIQLTGEQLGSFIIQYLSDGGVLDDVQADNAHQYVTFSSDEKEYIKSLKIYVNVPQGYTFKAYFNGQEVTGFTLDNNFYVVTLDESFITDGTWVVEFKKPAGITWTAVAMGAQNYLFSVQYDGDPVIPNLDSENHVSFSSGQVTPEQVQDISGLYVMAEPGYTFDLTFNGINLNGVFGEGTLRTINGKTYYEYQMTDAITDYKPILSTDGTWVVEFKVEGITWNGMIIGDVPQGAVVDLGLDYMTMEVFLNAEETSASDTYTGSTEGVSMNADITVPTGYNFKVWFNGEEKSTIFTYHHTMSNGEKVYIYNSNENSQNAPYLQDGQWIILFYDDLERYDVNRDGTISIADVTTLVNKILGKPTN